MNTLVPEHKRESSPQTPERLVAVHRSPHLRALGNGVVFLGLAAVGIWAALVNTDLSVWVRLLLAATGLYLIYAFRNNARSWSTPPRLEEAGLFFYGKPDGDYLARGQFVRWEDMTRLTFLPSGLVWIEHTVREDSKSRTRRDPLATQLFVNGTELRDALYQQAERRGLLGEGVPA